MSFQYEPIAAAFDYESRIEREERVLIVDIGGGTSDFSLVRLSPERRAVDDRQADILRQAACISAAPTSTSSSACTGDAAVRLWQPDEKRCTDAYQHPPQPRHRHTINAVYAPASQRALQSMRYDIVDPTGIDRLFRLIEQRAGHWLAMRVSRARSSSPSSSASPSISAHRAGSAGRAEPAGLRERHRRAARTHRCQHQAAAG